MIDRILRDPMTLDEERRAALNLHEQSAHARLIRDEAPAIVAIQPHPRAIARSDSGNELLTRFAGAILDCGNER